MNNLQIIAVGTVVSVVLIESLMMNIKLKMAMRQKKKIQVIETNPCIEFWFLLHFLQTLSTKCYENYEAVVKDLRRYLPDYEKSKQYLSKEKLYRELFDNEKLFRATDHADQLLKLAQETPEALHSYTEIHEVLK